MLEYVSKRPDGSFVNNKEEDYGDYKQICSSLVEYLSSLFMTGNDAEQAKTMQNSYAGQLLQRLNSHNSIIYTFNYTPLCLIINAVLGSVSTNPIWVHGEIKEEVIYNGSLPNHAIVLGIEPTKISSIAPDYSFMIKSNNASYKSSSIAYDLLHSKRVIIFGHSLNQMDFGYFENYFKVLASDSENERRLTIITKDEESRIELLDNIRKQGISVRDIFSHTTLDSILTTKLDNKDENELEKFKKLLISL